MTADIEEKVLDKLATFAVTSNETLEAELAEELGRIHAEVLWKVRAKYPSQLEALCWARVTLVDLAQSIGADPEMAMRSFERKVNKLRRVKRGTV